MPHMGATLRSRTPWLITVGLLLTAGVAATLGSGWFASERPAVASLVQPTAPAPPAPEFDIVRVSPDGRAVIAGRAEPGTEVTVHNGAQNLGHAMADQRGEWVLLPDAPLPQGGQELTLTSRLSSGVETAGTASVLLVVPPSAPIPGTPAAALAVLAPATAPSRLLQSSRATGGKLGLDTVDYDDHGDIRFSGSAPPRAAVRVYVDNQPAGDATANESGHWALSPAQAVAPGLHQLRVDQLAPNGRVAARVGIPFQRETLAAAQVAEGHVVVQPGQNLWRLARRAYGTGLRYTVIYQANLEQIRDPRLIYPGQAFELPQPAAEASTSASASPAR